jgi:peptidoglycan/xylan/chitin deacetylase (PgdA/CDA1 family)
LHSAGFEIGAHTLSHCVLSAVPPQVAQEEIFGSKRELEDLLGDDVRMFCYPRGEANAHAVHCVREAGYRGARGTRLLSIETMFSPFLMPTTVQAVPHRPMNYVKNLTRRRAWGSLYRYCSQLRGYPDWVALGKRLFDDVVKSGGVWHLWGHSWEIEKLGLWHDLEGLFDYVAGRTGVLYASNGSTIDAVQAMHLGSGGEKAV